MAATRKRAERPDQRAALSRALSIGESPTGTPEQGARRARMAGNGNDCPAKTAGPFLICRRYPKPMPSARAATPVREPGFPLFLVHKYSNPDFAIRAAPWVKR